MLTSNVLRIHQKINMKTILVTISVFFVFGTSYTQNEATRIDKEFALRTMLLLDGFEYSDEHGNIYYAIDTGDALNHMGTIVSRDKEGKVVLDYDQLHPITYQAIKELNLTNIRLKEDILELKSLIENIEIKLSNEIQQANYEIEVIKSEIAP